LRQISGAADAQKRSEVHYLATQLHDLVIQLGYQLVGGHAIDFGDLLQNLPELIFQPQRGHHAADAQGARA